MHYEVKVGNTVYAVSHVRQGGFFKIVIDGRAYCVDGVNATADALSLLIDHHSYDFIVTQGQDAFWVDIKGRAEQVELFDPRSKRPKESAQSSRPSGPQTILAPMAGQIVKVVVKPGDVVKGGDGLVILEAMKMENELKSRGPGEVREIFVRSGEVVSPGQRLLCIE